MRNSIIFILTASLFAACNKTENEENLNLLFFEAASSTEYYIYEDAITTSTVYLQDFNNVATSDWAESNDAYSVTAIQDGHLCFKGKQTVNISHDFDMDRSMDFQIEIRMVYNTTVPDHMHGIIFGENDPSFYYFVITNQTELPLSLGHCDGAKYISWYYDLSKISSLNDYHTYTIRKVGNKMSFFLDKTFHYMTDYNNFITNYGFMIYKGGSLSVDYVRVDYITKK
jgi:hypothetical protein